MPTMFSPLTAITGLTRSEIAAGRELGDVLEEMRSSTWLHPKTILVGQSPKNDIAWPGLVEGTDFQRAINIAEYFKTWNERYGNWNYFSLRQEAFGMLGVTMSATRHDPLEDTKVSMQLFVRYGLPILQNGDTSASQAAGRELTEMRYKRQFPDTTSAIGSIDGVCGSKYNSRYCICNQPSGD